MFDVVSRVAGLRPLRDFTLSVVLINHNWGKAL